jgi:hypothetical protein
VTGKPLDNLRFLQKLGEFVEKIELRIDVRRLLERGYAGGEMRYLPSFFVCNCLSRAFISRFVFIFVCLKGLGFVCVAVLIAV